MKKEKRKKIITNFIVTLLLLAVIGALGYDVYKKNSEKEQDTVQLTEEELEALLEQLNASTVDGENTAEATEGTGSTEEAGSTKENSGDIQADVTNNQETAETTTEQVSTQDVIEDTTEQVTSQEEE